MGEGLRNVAVLVWALCAVNSTAYAAEKPVIAEENHDTAPTIVYGAAQQSGGGVDAVVVEQPEGAPNPLGNPLDITDSGMKGEVNDMPASPQPSPEAVPASADAQNGSHVVPPQAAQKLGRDFQNTLLEADGMVYDVQAFPEKDMKVIGDPANPQTIYSPNVNP